MKPIRTAIAGLLVLLATTAIAQDELPPQTLFTNVHVYQDAHVRRALELGVKSIEHGQFLTEETARLLKENGAFIAPFTGGHTAFPERLSTSRARSFSKNTL